MIDSILDMIFGCVDFAWDSIRDVGSGIGFNLVAVLAGLCVVAAVIRLLLRPFLGTFLSGFSDSAKDPKKERYSRREHSRYEHRDSYQHGEGRPVNSYRSSNRHK